MRCNVDILKLIQLGITLTNAEGQVPAEGCTWQFNFYFNPECDLVPCSGAQADQAPPLL